jgi:ParB-like nuclease domain.
MATRTLTIGKKVFDVEEKQLNQVDLKFYLDNPRVYSALRADNPNPSQQEVENLLIDMDHVKQLRLSIESNGGLIDPLIVRDGDFVVLEGNSRLAAYRLLCRTNPAQWGKVPCLILPSNIDESTIFTLLGQYHIVGRKDWSPFEQAGYLVRRKNETKYPIEAMAKELGITIGDAKKFVSVYEFMVLHDDLIPARWSYYEEYLKNSGIKKYRTTDPTLDAAIVEVVKKEDINDAKDMRKLGEILSSRSKQAKQFVDKLKAGDTTINDAYEHLQDSGQINDIVKKLSKTREFLNDMDIEKKLFESNDEVKEKTKYELKKIGKRVEALLKKFE